MNAILIGAVEVTSVVLEALVRTELDVEAAISMEPLAGQQRHSDYFDIQPQCTEHGIECHRVSGEDQIADIVRTLRPDLLLVCGWSRLLSDAVIASARLGAVGFHPSPLPIGRGRHPLIWSIILGLSKGAVSFFRMRDVADAGEILAQRYFPIAADETARTLMDKVKTEAGAAIPTLVSSIVASGALKGMPQDEREAVTWRKRSASDGRIDFRMSAESVDRLVRALTRPYPGATATVGNGRSGAIWRTEVVTRPAASRWVEPGRVIGETGNGPVVACGLDAVVLAEHDLDSTPRPGDWFC